MNHYINLLDRSEIEYKSSSSLSPRLKYVGIGGAVVVFALFFLQYQGLRQTVNQGEELESTWERIQEDVEKAKVLHEKNLRLVKARETLRGWTASQHDWAAVIEYFAGQAPVPPADIQFTELSFDEQMQGMRAQVPSDSDAKFHPLKRQVTLTLQGMIRTDRPQRKLPEYRRNIAESELQPSEIVDVGLSNPVILEDEKGVPTGLSRFSLSIKLADKELLP